MALMSAVRPEDEALQQARMAAMQPTQIQHPMHAMVAPIGPPAPEPDPLTGSQMAEMQPDQQPSMAVGPKQPKVRTMAPLERYEDQLNKRQMADYEKDANPYGSENNHPGFFGKVLHGLSVATGGPNRRQFEEQQRAGEIAGAEKEQGALNLQQAQTEGAQQQGDLHEQQARAAELTPTSEEESSALGVPVGTMLNAASRAALSKQAGINTQRRDANQLTNQTRQDIADNANQLKRDIAAVKPEQRDDRAIRLNEKAALGEPLTQEENAYLGAYAKYIDQTKVQPGVARAQAFGMFRPVQILGLNGDVQYQFSGNAIRSGAATPSSMNFRTAAGMAKFMTSGKGGQTITAYNTANDHLELLGKAMDALQNGDVQGINQLNNAFRQQFGSAAPTNVNAVKAMLAGELANVAKVTGATDQEIQEQKENINRAASPEQIKGFIDTNHELMDQKAYEMYQQYQQGMQGQPAFNTGLSGHQPASGAGGGSQPKVLKFNATTGRLE